MSEPEPMPRRVTRGDAFALAPRPMPVPANDDSAGVKDALASFGCSAVFGALAFTVIVPNLLCTRGATRSAGFKKAERQRAVEITIQQDEERERREAPPAPSPPREAGP